MIRCINCNSELTLDPSLEVSSENQTSAYDGVNGNGLSQISRFLP